MLLRSRGLVVVIFLALVVQGLDARKPDPALWRYVHPGSKALVGIQWSRVQQSPIGGWVQKRWIGDLSMPGSEFLKDVEEVLISSPGHRDDSPDDEPPLLIAIRGNFNLAKVQQVLIRQGARKQMFSDVPIYRQPRKPDSEPAFALLSPQTILVGDAQSLFSTIERSRIPAQDDTGEALVARAQGLAARYDCWAVMTEAGTMRNFLFASLAGNAMSADSQGFEAGISVREGLAIDVTFTERDERAARVLMSKLNRTVRMAAADGGGSAEFGALLQKLRLSSDRSTVQMSLRMTGQEAQASLTPPARPPVKVVATAASQEASPPEKMVIRIEGLDDGPKEVPFK